MSGCNEALHGVFPPLGGLHCCRISEDCVEKCLELRRARLGQHLGARSLLPDPALMHEDQPRGDAAREAHLVGDQHHRHALARHLLQHLQHLADQLGIERRGDLVEQHQLRLHGERAGDRDALLLAARELVGIGVDLVLEPDAAQHVARRSRAPAAGAMPFTTVGASVMLRSTERCGNRL